MFGTKAENHWDFSFSLFLEEMKSKVSKKQNSCCSQWLFNFCTEKCQKLELAGIMVSEFLLEGEIQRTNLALNVSALWADILL